MFELRAPRKSTITPAGQAITTRESQELSILTPQSLTSVTTERLNFTEIPMKTNVQPVPIQVQEPQVKILILETLFLLGPKDTTGT